MDGRIFAVLALSIIAVGYFGLRAFDRYEAIKHQSAAQTSQVNSIHDDVTAIGSAKKIANAVKDGIHGTVIHAEGEAIRVEGATEKALKEFHDKLSQSELAQDTKKAMQDGVNAFLHAAEYIGIKQKDEQK